MKNYSKLIFFLILFPSYAPPTVLSLLDDIKDAYEEPQTLSANRGYTNILAYILDDDTQATSLGKYWTGEAKYLDPMNRIEYAQLLYDTLLAFPHLEFNGSSTNNIEEVFGSLYHIAIKSLPTNSQKVQARRLVMNLRDKPIFEAFYDLYVLSSRATNCLHYWEGGDEALQDLLHASIELRTFSGSIPTSLEYCEKPMCTTDVNRPYNGFYDISALARSTKLKLERISCDDSSITSGRHAAGKRKLCLAAKQLIRNDHGIEPVYIPSTSQNLAVSAGKIYMERLQDSIPSILKILKTIVILQIDEAITDPRYNAGSVSTLYQPPDDIIIPCSQSQTSTSPPNANSKHCDNQILYSPDGNVDDYISQLLGLGQLEPVIEEGLPIGLPDTTALVAGTYMTFQQINPSSGRLPSPPPPDTLWKCDTPLVSLYPPFGRPIRNYHALFTTYDRIQAFKTYRDNIIYNFYRERQENRTEKLSELMTKSTSLDIINDIRSQNEKIISFEDTANQFRTRQLTLLKDSANWRLEASNQSWIADISTISNVSLLREIAILLAEIKHVQFHRLANTQKLTLISSIISVQQNAPPDAAFREIVKIGIERYLSGGAGGSTRIGEDGPSVPDPNSFSVPPNQGAIDSQTDTGLAGAREAARNQ